MRKFESGAPVFNREFETDDSLEQSRPKFFARFRGQPRLAFDPAFHDADALIEAIDEPLLPYDRLNKLAAAIQTEITVSPAIETYLIGLWDALRDPVAAGISIEEVSKWRVARPDCLVYDGRERPQGASTKQPNKSPPSPTR